jgi:hypothetical protein
LFFACLADRGDHPRAQRWEFINEYPDGFIIGTSAVGQDQSCQYLPWVTRISPWSILGIALRPFEELVPHF